MISTPSALTLTALACSVLLAASAAAQTQPSAPPAPPPDVLKLAEQAMKDGRGFQLIPPQTQAASGSATGASSRGVGDGINMVQNGTAPSVTLPGQNSSGGDNRSSSKANAFAPFDSSEASNAGFACIALGVGILIAAAWFPKIPLTAGFVAIGTGVVLLVFPRFLNEHPALAVVAAGLLGTAVLLVVGYKAKWFDQAIGPEAQRRLIAKNQIVAAGALATLETSKPFASSRTVARAAETVADAKKVIAKSRLAADPDAPKDRPG